MTNAKELIFEDEARIKLHQGVEQLADVVSVTLGPRGRNVGIEASWGAPTITNDGYTIVKDVELKDQYHQMGAAICKEAASKMKERCGDGTTTTIVLLRALVQNGLKNIAAGATPIALKRGMDRALEAMTKELSALSAPIKNDQDIKNIAIVSASGHEEVGKTIAETIGKTGKEGIITIEDGKTIETTTEFVEGMEFDRGYLSPYFVTNTENLTVELHNVNILATDKKISSIQEILPLLQLIASSGQELLIISDDIDGDALSTLVVNRLRGTLKVCGVKAPGFGDERKAILQDIAILTGGTVVSEETGHLLKEVGIDQLGHVEKVVITREKTTLIGGEGTPKAIEARVQQIDAEMKTTKGTYELEKLRVRRGKLTGGAAVIRVGAPTEPEMKQKKQLFQDSLNSTKAALEDGVVPGGGVALYRAARAIASLNLSGDELTGAQIVFKACEAPLRQIVQNGGGDGSVVLDAMSGKGSGFGYNALTEKVEDLSAAGVVDPTKVVKSALQFAISSAGVVLLSEVLIGSEQ